MVGKLKAAPYSRVKPIGFWVFVLSMDGCRGTACPSHRSPRCSRSCPVMAAQRSGLNIKNWILYGMFHGKERKIP